jgi:hypothetical protein
MPRTARRQNLLAATWPVLDDAHPVTVIAIGGQQDLAFESSHASGDEGLRIVAPCRQGADPHGHQPFTAALAGEKPLLESVTTVVRAADEPIMAGEGMGYD